MNGKSTIQIPTETFEATVLDILATTHYNEYEHQFRSLDSAPERVCAICRSLRNLETFLSAPAPDFTQADVDQMAEIMLLEQELAFEQARCYIDSATYPATDEGDGLVWNDTEVDSVRDRENIAKAIKYLQHRHAIEIHPKKPQFVRIKEGA